MRTLSDRLVARYVARAPRNPDTGILLGAEPRDVCPAYPRGAVLLVHGFNGSPNNFNDLPDRLAAAGWRAKAPLLPGHGTTPHAFEKTTPDDLRVAVVDALRELRREHETVALLGHSMGGALAVLAAAEEPPDALLLVSPFFRVTYRWFYLLPAESWAKLTAGAVRWLPSIQEPVNLAASRAQIISYRWTPTRGACTAIALAEAARAKRMLKRVDCPVLLVHARGDEVTCPEAARKAVEAMPADRKSFVWLTRSNHIVFWDYDQDDVAREVIGFLDTLPSASPA